MELTILGTNSPYPHGGRATLGYLLEQDGAGLLLDAGFGIYRRLFEEGLFPRVTGILLSHLHSDHCADLPAVILGATVDRGREEKIPVFLPPGEAGRLNDWLSACGFGFVLGFADQKESSYGTETPFGPLRLTLNPARHGLPAAITTVAAAGKRLVYTGDTSDCPALRAALHQADLVLTEVSPLTPDEAETKGHLTATALGEIARASGVKRLVLTHFMPGADPEALARQVAETYGQLPEIACEGRRITLT